MNTEFRRFVADVKKGFADAKILLFGSRAKGNARSDSDYDVIIVSKAFTGVPYVDRAYYVRVNNTASIAADILCYSPTEFKSIAAKSVVLKDALKYAVTV